MEKNGMLTDKSQSDYDHTKKAEYYDAEGFSVADKEHKHLLKRAESVESLHTEEKE
jgi:hypothetical protein